MTQWDRYSPGCAAPSPMAGPLWEPWYQAATPEQRQQALALARQFPLVPTRLLPSFEDSAPRPALLARLLCSTPPSLVCVEAAEVKARDAALDTCQRRAVARALASPDVSLIQGGGGTGKSRAVAELIVQSLERGLRVLLASGSPNGTHAALGMLPDEVLESALLLYGKETASGRAASADFHLRRQELDARVKGLQQSLLDAKTSLDARRSQSDAVSNEAASVLQRLETLASSKVALTETRKEPGPEAPTGPVWARAQEEARTQEATHLARSAAITIEKTRLLLVQKERQAESERLAPLAEVRRAGRWWSIAWWQSLFAGDVNTRQAEHSRKDAETTNTLASLDSQLAEESAALLAVRAARAARAAELLEQERLSRQETLAAEEAFLALQIEEAHAGWSRLWGQSAPVPSAAGLASGRAGLRANLDAEASRLDALKRWAVALDHAGPYLEAMLLDVAPLLAGPADALLAIPAGRFDLLIVEDAHLMDEETLLALAARAPRWTLVGEPPLASPVLPGRPPVPSAAPFHRLWDRLHADPRRLPCRWRVAGGRLVATLWPLAEAEPGSLHQEAVYDRPEIEVRIACRPGGVPCVFEVSFPAHTPAAEARAFIYRELQELSIEANGSGASWSADGEAWSLHLSSTEGESSLVPLEDGIGERLVRCAAPEGCSGWTTAGIVFYRAQGWDRLRAEQWAETRLGLRDTGRTSSLDTPRRAESGLARFVFDCLHRHGSPPPTSTQFIPVPSLTGQDTAPRLRNVAACGAGLEIDLGEPRSSPHPALPTEVLDRLPAKGIVNPAEAQVIFSLLERELADEQFVAQAKSWQESHDGPAVAVVSCNPAQVALMRAMLEPLARNAPVRVEVVTPEALRGKGCWACVISLVRSRGTEPVPFSCHPAQLALLLTRPAGRLLVVGDPGSLLRRSQWFGKVEPQGDASPHEQAMLQALAVAWPDRLVSSFPVEAGKPQRSRESSSV